MVWLIFWQHIVNPDKVPFHLISGTIWFGWKIRFLYFEPPLWFLEWWLKNENFILFQNHAVRPIMIFYPSRRQFTPQHTILYSRLIEGGEQRVRKGKEKKQRKSLINIELRKFKVLFLRKCIQSWNFRGRLLKISVREG